jgi:DNA-binding protein HU-beta
MNKGDFITYISEQYNITKIEAEKTIDMFVRSATNALGDGEEIALTGFGNFSVSRVEARAGRNPRTGEVLQIKAYNQPKFKTGQKLKDAVNNK